MKIPNELFTKVLSTAAESAKPTSGLFGLLSDNSISLINLLLSAVVVLLELLLSSKVFDCPLNNHMLYGVLFLVSPFFIVFIVNVLLVGNPWDITDRWCIERYRRRGTCMKCFSGEFCYWVLPNIAKAFVGPCVWLIASFADTEYYVCAAVGQDIEKRNLTNVTEIEELEAEFADAKARSVIAAWLVFGVLTLGLFLVLIVKKCCLKENILLEDEYYYERREAIAAIVTFRHYISHGEQGDFEKGEGNNNQANPDSTAITIENGSGAGEDKNEDKKKKDRKQRKDKKDKKDKKDGNKLEVEMTPTSPGTSAGSTDMGVSVPGSRPIASSADAIEPAPASPNVKASASSAVASESTGPSPSASEDKKEDKKEQEPRKERIIGWFKKILGVGQDEKKDEENNGEQRIVGRFMGKEEEIIVYPEGIPEQEGKKWVEEQFDEGKHYLAVYKEIEKKYPRVIKGQPWKPWVEKPDDETKKEKNSTVCPIRCSP